MNEIVRASVRVRCPVVCVDCGLRVASDAFTVEIEDTTPEELYQRLRTTNAGPHFPVGWAAYGYPNYRCPECKDHVRWDQETRTFVSTK